MTSEITDTEAHRIAVKIATSGKSGRVHQMAYEAAKAGALAALAARPAPEAGSVGLIAELRHAAYTEPEPNRSSLHLKAAAAIAERDERLSTARMIAEAAEDQRDAAKARASELQREVERLRGKLNNAADTAYRMCAETRHVTLGDKLRAALQQEGESDGV